jgi:hypothetical protein
MSRDPEEGETTDPASLHKYLYAGGDPVNLADPSGRNAMPVYIPPPGPELVPPSTPKPAWGAMEYTLVLGVAALGSVAASKKEACAINTAFSTLGLSMGSVPSGGGMAIPEPEKCKAKCPPCDPPAGTQCFEPHSGHPILKISVGIRIITCGGGIRILIHAVAIGTI